MPAIVKYFTAVTGEKMLFKSNYIIFFFLWFLNGL